MPQELRNELPAEGYVREKQIIGPGKALPIGKSSWWRGIRDGIYPQPIKLGPNTTVWRVDDIRALLQKGAA